MTLIQGDTHPRPVPPMASMPPPMRSSRRIRARHKAFKAHSVGLEHFCGSPARRHPLQCQPGDRVVLKSSNVVEITCQWLHLYPAKLLKH